jgi:cyclophilin family peptidyl-prolyl cis-trans isomerase
MLRSLLLVAVVLFSASVGSAQTVRFQTSVGAFDMVLNPTGNANLQGHVDNMLANVAAGVYHYNVVNRADDNFVLQIGSFRTTSVDLGAVPATRWTAPNSFRPLTVDTNRDFRPEFPTTGLTNTRGTVSLALSGDRFDSSRRNDLNSGSASFFVNVGENTFLDVNPASRSGGFIPFATISDMSVVDRLMGLPQVDLSRSVGQPGSLAFSNVPLTDNGDLVVIESAMVISPNNVNFVNPLLTANARPLPPVPGGATPSAITAAGSSVAVPSGAALMSSGASTSFATPLAIPEPSAVCLVAVVVGLPLVRSGRKR